MSVHKQSSPDHRIIQAMFVLVVRRLAVKRGKYSMFLSGLLHLSVG